jgi:hypothetical protein
MTETMGVELEVVVGMRGSDKEWLFSREEKFLFL